MAEARIRVTWMRTEEHLIHQELDKVRKDPPLEPPEAAGPRFPDFRLWPPD